MAAWNCSSRLIVRPSDAIGIFCCSDGLSLPNLFRRCGGTDLEGVELGRDDVLDVSSASAFSIAPAHGGKVVFSVGSAPGIGIVAILSMVPLMALEVGGSLTARAAPAVSVLVLVRDVAVSVVPCAAGRSMLVNSCAVATDV